MRKVIVNFSGGVDSNVAILETLKIYPKEEISLCYQDTGADYLETKPHVEKIASMLELPLVILKPKRNFWEEVERRKWFPDPAVRFCTSYLKRDLFNHYITETYRGTGTEIVVVNGVRAEESPSRAKLKEWQSPEEVHYVKSVSKLWHPCLHMSKVEVKERVEAEGLPLHPCYEFASRCSCWCCIFGSQNEVRTYAEMQPELYKQACLLEDKIKNKWKYRFGFNDLFKQGGLF